LDNTLVVVFRDECGAVIRESITPEQASVFYKAIGDSLANDDRVLPLLTLVMKEDFQKPRRYPLNPAEAFTLYQTLGKFLQKHYPNSVPRLQFLEASS
jgi:hypothetical protein